jgi:hypothetical protein
MSCLSSNSSDKTGSSQGAGPGRGVAQPSFVSSLQEKHPCHLPVQQHSRNRTLEVSWFVKLGAIRRLWTSPRPKTQNINMPNRRQTHCLILLTRRNDTRDTFRLSVQYPKNHEKKREAIKTMINAERAPSRFPKPLLSLCHRPGPCIFVLSEVQPGTKFRVG